MKTVLQLYAYPREGLTSIPLRQDIRRVLHNPSRIHQLSPIHFHWYVLGHAVYDTLQSSSNARRVGLVYPPKFNAQSDNRGGELSAFVLEGKAIDESTSTETAPTNGATEPNSELQKRIDEMNLSTIDPSQQGDQETGFHDEDPEIFESSTAVDTFTPIGPDADHLLQPSQGTSDLANLFSSLSFFLSRETPRHPLEFLLRAFGCKRISWDAVLGEGAYTNDELDSSITHQVVDRPLIAAASEENGANTGRRMANRTYVQPQWVWDCINEGKLLRPDLYAPGATLPPHLSPWVKPTKRAYDPTAPLAEQEREGEAEEALLQDESESSENGQDVIEEEQAQATAGAADEESELEDHGMSIASEASDSDDASQASAPSFGGFSDPENMGSDAESDTSETRYQRELEAEAAGLTFTETKLGKPKGILKNSSQVATDEKKRKALAKQRKGEEEELERRKMMMGRRKRKLVEKMLYSNSQKDGEAEKLRAKRRKIEMGKAVK